MQKFLLELTEEERSWLAGLVADYAEMFPDEKIALEISKKLGTGKRVFQNVIIDDIVNGEDENDLSEEV